MENKIRLEEYAPLGDFIMVSYVRDFEAIRARYPKLKESFRDDFETQLGLVKRMEGKLVLTSEQKKATEALYAEANVLNGELTFLNSYFKEIGLDTRAVTALKYDLSNGNIEGAILKMEDVRQYIVANHEALEEEGMAADFPATMAAHKESMAGSNALQYTKMIGKKTLTSENMALYTSLYGSIARIARAGKLVFKGTVTEDEYVIAKIIMKMRAPKRKPDTGDGGTK